MGVGTTPQGFKDFSPPPPSAAWLNAIDALLIVYTAGGLTPALFSAGSPGIVPASGGGNTNFLRADGTWAAPTAGAVVTQGTSVLTLTGCTTSPTVTANWATIGGVLALMVVPAVTATSNTTTCTLTGMDASLAPIRTQSAMAHVQNNGADASGMWGVSAGSTVLTLGNSVTTVFPGPFTSSGGKGIPDPSIYVWLLI